jgi:tagatose 1,6-diphosphate aldolase
MESNGFEFRDPGALTDGDLELHLVERRSGDPRKGLVPEYKFEMRRSGSTEAIGYIHLRVALTPKLEKHGGHIGYSVEPAYRGHHYAARSCRLLFALATEHRIDPILITCAEDNVASRRTCEMIGGELVHTETIEIEPGLWRSTCYYHVRAALGRLR